MANCCMHVGVMTVRRLSHQLGRLGALHVVQESVRRLDAGCQCTALAVSVRSLDGTVAYRLALLLFAGLTVASFALHADAVLSDIRRSLLSSAACACYEERWHRYVA